jgi:competence protein ComEA
MKKGLVSLLLGMGMLFALNPQTASKEDLMKIKGVGEKKAEAIIQYRKKHKLKSVEDLAQVKGIGEVIAKNIINDVLNGEKSSASSKKKTTKKSTKSKDKSTKSSKKDNKKESKSKKSESKKDSKSKNKDNKKDSKKKDKKAA